jgi:hypothetical protein
VTPDNTEKGGPAWLRTWCVAIQRLLPRLARLAPLHVASPVSENVPTTTAAAMPLGKNTKLDDDVLSAVYPVGRPNPQKGKTVTRQCVTQRPSEGSRRYLAMPASGQPIKPSFVAQPSHTVWSGLLGGNGDEAIWGGT